jgi:hypothetical protein
MILGVDRDEQKRPTCCQLGFLGTLIAFQYLPQISLLCVESPLSDGFGRAHAYSHGVRSDCRRSGVLEASMDWWLNAVDRRETSPEVV